MSLTPRSALGSCARTRADARRSLDRRIERAAVRRPAVVAHGALARRAPEPLAAAPDRSALRARAASASGDRRVVEQALALVPTSAGMRSTAGATTGRPDAMYSKIFSGDQ